MNHTIYGSESESIYPVLIIAQTLMLYPVFILVGLITNILALTIFLQKYFRKNITYIALVCVSICDIGFLVVGVGNQFFRHSYLFDIRTISDFSCKFHVALTHIFVDNSIWILCIITIQRVFMVWSPNKSQSDISICSMTSVLLIIGSLLIIKNCILGSQCEIKTIANIQGIPDKLC